MNIKSLRKNYDQLSKRERLILYDSAENRDDNSEMDAIMLATPNEDWLKPDFALQAEQLLKLRLLMSAQQLKHSRKAMFWLLLSVTEEQTNQGKKRDGFFYESARLCAYFYCVSAGTYRGIFEELGLDADAWEKKKIEIFDLDFADEAIDKHLRHIAFDEKEAEAFINKIAGEHGIKNVVLGFTVETELKGMREILKEQGFKDFFKN